MAAVAQPTAINIQTQRSFEHRETMVFESLGFESLNDSFHPDCFGSSRCQKSSKKKLRIGDGRTTTVNMRKLEFLERHPHFAEARSIVERLKEHGFEALLAGGCVRDALLGRFPKDIDVATSARPADIERLFAKTIGVGRDFGTMIVVGGNAQYEVTTFRQDGDYLDGRHPSKVTFSDATEDAKRRDFTVNALFYDVESARVLDFVNGTPDLSRKLIRTVGDPVARFSEDHLRLLRAVRFCSQLEFAIEENTWRAIQSMSARIVSVSVERVLQELLKLLSGVGAQTGLKLLVESGLAKSVWPSLDRLFQDKSRYENFNRRVSGIRQPEVIIALLGVAGGERDAVLRDLQRLKPPRPLVQSVRELMEAHDLLWNGNARVSERVLLWARPNGMLILSMAEAEARERSKGMERLESWIAEFLAICDAKGRLPAPYLRGEDLLGMGFVAGPHLGRTLDELYRLQLEGGVRSVDQAEDIARARLSKMT